MTRCCQWKLRQSGCAVLSIFKNTPVYFGPLCMQEVHDSLVSVGAEAEQLYSTQHIQETRVLMCSLCIQQVRDLLVSAGAEAEQL
jgi:hypothetical protein